ncbi:MAG TPA: EamA family transporter [Candidatus Dormibacteraeota bacterium]|nr:EamA family transporter [Candidatus Dormibacteraeota bacterium]
MTRRGWALFAAMAIIWGIPYLLIKVAVADLTPIALVLLRTTIGALLLVPLAAARGSLTPLLRHWKWVLAYTLVEVALPWLLLSNAETRLTSSLTGLLIAAVPLIGAVLTVLTGDDDRLDARRAAGLAIGFVGVAALLGLDFSVVDPGAAAQVGLVAVGYAIGPMIVARRLVGVPSLGVVAASLGLTALVYAPVGVLQLPHTMPPLRVLGAVAVLGVLCTALAFLLFFALIGEVGPLRAQAITYVNPAVALAAGVLLLGEPFTIGAAVGFGLIVVGLLLATRRRAAGSERSDAPAGDAAA